MKKKALLVVNPISGGNDKSELVRIVTAFAHDRGYDTDLYETTGEDDDGAIRKLFDENRPQRVIIAGGDGTIKSVGEILHGRDASFGILAAGSANGLAVDLGIPDDLDLQLAAAFGDRSIEIDAIWINGIKSLHLSDIGLNAELIKNYESGNLRGKIGYAFQAVNTLASAGAPFHARIEANGRVLETDAKMIVIANSQKYGTGVTINPMGQPDDGKFEVVIIKNLGLLVFSKIVVGKMPLDTGDIEIISTDSATIQTDVPVHFQVDGEYCDKVRKLEVAIQPNQMRIAVPDP